MEGEEGAAWIRQATANCWPYSTAVSHGAKRAVEGPTSHGHCPLTVRHAHHPLSSPLIFYVTGTLPNSTVPSCKANKTCIPTIEEYNNVHEGVPPMKQYNWPECAGP